MVSRAATAGLVLVAAAGAWLVVAPFALRFQPHGTRWVAATRIDVGVGAVLLMAGVAGLLIMVSGRVSELYADAPRPERPPS